MAVQFLICFLPYILFFLGIYIIVNTIRAMLKKTRLNIYGIAAVLLITIILVDYYKPINNVLEVYNLDYFIISDENKGHIEVDDKHKVNRILSIINKHTFTRSAIRTISMQNFADRQSIIISTHHKQPPIRVIHIYVLKDKTENNALQIQEQLYNIKDSEKFSDDIFDALKELELLTD